MTPGHSAGALSAPAKCRESDGRAKEMICGQSSTLMVLTALAVHSVAAEYIVEIGWAARIQFDQAGRQIPPNVLLPTHSLTYDGANH